MLVIITRINSYVRTQLSIKKFTNNIKIIVNKLKSIRFRLLIAFIIVSILPLILFTNILFSTLEKYYEQEKKTEMYRQANVLGTNLLVTGFDFKYVDDITSYVNGRILIVDSRSTVVYDSYNMDNGKLYVTEEVLLGQKGQSKFYNLKNQDMAKVVVPIKDDKENILGIIMITSSFQEIYDSISSMQGKALLLILGLIIFLFFVSYNISGFITNPFNKLLQSIYKITDGHLDEKIDIKGNYEIEEIGNAVNLMTDRLAEIEENRQQFVANVSHELKTPLSSVKVLAESLLMQPEAPKELYREFLEDISAEIERENTIINSLLTLVTLRKNEDALNLSDVNLNKLIESILKRLKPLAEKKKIEIIFESYREVIAELDETKISLAISNLVENAIKYNIEGGWIRVTLNSDYKNAKISFIDSGIGIPKESGTKIFQRFYRVDKNRSRETGGTGLGLSIAQKSVLMHNGSIKYESELGVGTTFVLCLPLKQK